MDRSGARDRIGGAGWLIADAALAAILAATAEALLLFLLSPERPLTLGDFAATLLALTPHVVVVFVLGGPSLVLLGRLLSVARTTQRGISIRYVLRFALLDALLLSLTALFQWRRFESVLPEPGRTALALMTTALVLTAATLLVILLRDAWRPLVNLVPWLAATAVGLLVTLGIAAELRRVRVPAPEPLSLPGFVPAAPIVVIEVPGLSPRSFRDAARRGETPFLARVGGTGVRGPVRAGTVDDSLALHATLMTGQGPSRHGVLRAVRYQPLGDRRSFAVLPYGLLLRPLVNTPLWRRIPVDHRVLRAIALPGIVEALSGGRSVPPGPDDLSLALVGDPLGWPAERPGWIVVSEERLRRGGGIDVGGEVVDCESASHLSAILVDPPASSLEQVDEDAELLAKSLSADFCGLKVAATASARGVDILYLRLPGYPDVARRFGGFEPGSQARGVSEREVAAYGRVLRRYLRALDPLLESVAGSDGALVAIVSPHGARPRDDFGRVLTRVVGIEATSATFVGGLAGFYLMSGPGVARMPPRREVEVDLAALLPTLLAAARLPVALDMTAPAADLLAPEAGSPSAWTTVPGYAVSRATR